MKVKRREVTVPFTDDQKKGAFVTLAASRARRNHDKHKGIILEPKPA